MKFVDVVFFMSSFAFAAAHNYDLKIILSQNGKTVFSPRFVVKAGESTLVTQKTNTGESFIEVVATEAKSQNHKGMMMTFVVGVISKNGVRTIKAKPRIVVNENEMSQISTREDNGEEITISVVANRKIL